MLKCSFQIYAVVNDNYNVLEYTFSVNKIFGHFTTLVRNNDIPLRIAPHYVDKPQVKIVAIFNTSIINCQVIFFANRIICKKLILDN